MFTPFERLLAWRYLKSRKKEGFLSLTAAFAFTGIMLGVATLIIVMSVMNGFRADLLERILGFTGHMDMVVAKPEGMQDFSDFVKDLKKDQRLTHVTPLIVAQAMVTHGGDAVGVRVNGIIPEDLQNRSFIADHMRYGSLTTFKDGKNTVLIGERMAHKLRLLPGSRVTLVAPQGTPTAFGTLPRVKSFIIGGIFKVGMSQYDENVIFMPLEAAQTFFKLPNAINTIEIFTQDPQTVQGVREDLQKHYASMNGLMIYDWMQSNAPFFGAVKVERNVMFVILTLIILIAAFNIISTLVMLVKNKSRDIAILRTMGASRLSITKIFFLTGASISFLGTALGVALGLLFCAHIESIRQGIQKFLGTDLFNEEIYFLSHLPAKVNPWEVMSIVAMALGISFIFSIFPALRAARLDPVEALRYE